MKNISNAHPNSAHINMLKIILYTLHNALMCQNKENIGFVLSGFE